MDDAFALLELLGRGGILLHYSMVGKIARGEGLRLTDRQVLSILSRDDRFERIEPGVYYIRGKRPGRRILVEELEVL